MLHNKKNFVVHHDNQGGGISRKTWIIIGCVFAAIALVVALVLLIPKFAKNGENNNEGNQNNNQTPNAEPKVAGIYVSETPDKMVYYVGDTPNYSGLVIGVSQVADKGTTLSYDEAYNELTITGFDSSVPVKEQVITVQYKEFTTTFTVEIKELVTEATRLTGIRIDPLPDKLTYKLGEALDYTGGRVVCEYSDGTTKVLRLDSTGVRVSGFATITTPGEYDITVKYYDDKGGYASTTFKITMTE